MPRKDPYGRTAARKPKPPKGEGSDWRRWRDICAPSDWASNKRNPSALDADNGNES